MNARQQIITAIQGFEFEHYGMVDERTDGPEWVPLLADRIMSALRIAPDTRHGEGSLPHGYDGDCGDDCDNRQCPGWPAGSIAHLDPRDAGTAHDAYHLYTVAV